MLGVGMLDTEKLNMATPTKIPSPEEVEAAKTGRGGFKRAVLESWGIAWPPKKGWRTRLRLAWEEQEQARKQLPFDKSTIVITASSEEWQTMVKLAESIIQADRNMRQNGGNK